MQRTLSSSLTVVWKFLFPTVWISGFGAGTAGVWLGAFRGPDHELPPDAMRWIFVGVWLIASTFLVWFARRLHRVSLHDGVLTVSNYFREISVPLANVSRVTQSYMSRPPTITIHLHHPTLFGQRIVFVPAGSPRFLSKHPTTTELKNILFRTHEGNHANA
jgi:hypothetical protein